MANRRGPLNAGDPSPASPSVSRLWMAGLLGLALAGCGARARREPTLPAPGTSRFDVYVRTRLPQGEPPPCALRGLALGDTQYVRSFATEVTFTLPGTYNRVHGDLRLTTAHFLGSRTRDAWEWESDVKLEPGEMWIGGPAGDDEAAMLLQVSRQAGYIPFVWEKDRELTEVRECALRLGEERARVLFFTLTSRTGRAVYGAAAYWRSPRGLAVSTLALGPDQATQAEFVTILRSAR